MHTSPNHGGELLFQQIIHQSNQLENFIEAGNWGEAVRVERERFSLLQQLATVQSVTKSERYAAFLQQALDFIRAKQPKLQLELQQSKRNLSEHGHKRAAVRTYQDISLT